jgi:hypothetical protein
MSDLKARTRWWTDMVCHSGLDPESSSFLDSRFRGNDLFIAINVVMHKKKYL